MASCRSVVRQQLSRSHLACPLLSGGSQAKGTPLTLCPGAMMRAPRRSRIPNPSRSRGAWRSHFDAAHSTVSDHIIDFNRRGGWTHPVPSSLFSRSREAGLLQGGRSMCERLAVGPGTRQQYTVLFMIFHAAVLGGQPLPRRQPAPGFAKPDRGCHACVPGRPPPAAPRRPAGCARGTLDASSSTSLAWVPEALPARQPLPVPGGPDGSSGSGVAGAPPSSRCCLADLPHVHHLPPIRRSSATTRRRPGEAVREGDGQCQGPAQVLCPRRGAAGASRAQQDRDVRRHRHPRPPRMGRPRPPELDEVRSPRT